MTDEAPAATPPSALKDRLIELSMELIAKRGWRDWALADLATESSTGLAAVYDLYPSKQAILVAFLRRIDRVMLTPAAGGEEGSARDRLFEVVMRRLDALAPYKAALRRLTAELPGDPLAAAALAVGLRRSAGWMLESAGIGQSGLIGLVRVKGLIGVYLATFRVWLADDQEDQGQTMAALDRYLARAELIMNSLPRKGRADSVG